MSYSPNARPRANELRQDKDYQGILQAEVPNLVCHENRLQNQIIVNGQEQTPVCQQQRSKISSSPFRRTVSSSALRSPRESESGDIESVS